MITLARRGVASTLVAALWAVPAWAGVLDDVQGDDPQWTEQAPEGLPPLPDSGTLEAVILTGAGRHSHFVERSSLKVGEDGVVRFVLVLKPENGPRQSSYVGLRCRTGQWKTYAYSTQNGPWRAVSSPLWEDVERKIRDSVRSDLYRHYFCAGSAVAGDAKQLLQRLRRPPVVSKPRY